MTNNFSTINPNSSFLNLSGQQIKLFENYSILRVIGRCVIANHQKK